jgi:RecA/RadA recombinase
MVEVSKEKLKALEQAVAQIDRQFGKGALVRLGDKPHETIHFISTGSIAVDAALGIGGVPRGRVVEVFGPEASGKTTLTLHIIAEAQKRGGLAACDFARFMEITPGLSLCGRVAGAGASSTSPRSGARLPTASSASSRLSESRMILLGCSGSRRRATAWPTRP